MRSWASIILWSGLLAMVITSLTFLYPLKAQGPSDIRGKVVNGTRGGGLPSDLQVTLHFTDQDGSARSLSTGIDSEGNFQFQGFPLDTGSAYFLAVRYRDVTYSLQLDASSVSTPADLTIYEVMSDVSAISIDGSTMIVGWANATDRDLGVLERVRLRNSSDRTFVPDLEKPEGMNFLRFPLPPSYTNLRVQADLAEGQVVPIDRGFALTTPVPPGVHELFFTYLFSYEGQEAKFVRTFPFSTESFMLLIREDVGRVRMSGLTQLGDMQIGESRYLSAEVADLKSGSSTSIELYGLPQPTIWQRVSKALKSGAVRVAIVPGLMGLLLAGVLAYLFFFRGNRYKWAASSSSEGREALIEAIAKLDELYGAKEMGEKEYVYRRAQLKARLLSMERARNTREV